MNELKEEKQMQYSRWSTVCTYEEKYNLIIVLKGMTDWLIDEEEKHKEDQKRCLEMMDIVIDSQEILIGWLFSS